MDETHNMNINRTVTAGNLTRDPELKYTPKGTAVAQIWVAVNRRWKGEDGEQKEETTFVDVTFFGKTAETVGQYLRKGQPIYVEGRLKLDSWEDKTTGQKRQKLHVIGESFQFVGRKSDDDGAGGSARPAGRGDGAGARRSGAAQPAGEGVQPDPEPGNDADVPF